MDNIFWIKRGKRITAVNPAGILYIKGSKYGCHLFYRFSNNSFNGKTIISSSTLSYFENVLKSHGFLRCHRNYLVNPLLIDDYCMEKSIISIGRQIIPVSKRKKSELFRFALAKKLTKSKDATCWKTAL